MREILIVAGRDPRSEVSGGHSSYVRALGRAVAGAGFAPVLVCAGGSADSSPTPEGRIERIATRFEKPRQTIAPWLERPLADALERLAARAADPVLIHGVGLWAGAALRARRNLRRRGRRAVAVVSSYMVYREQARSQVRALAEHRGHLGAGSRLRTRFESWWIHLLCHRYEGRCYREADAIYLHYECIHRLIARNYGEQPHCRRIDSCAAAAFEEDASAAAARAPAPNIPLILSVSRADPRKANDLLLHSLASLHRRGRRFRAAVIGGGPLLQEQQALAARLGLAGIVESPGVVADLRPLRTQASIFVLSTRAEQSGSLAVLEALQYGLPIVATAVDGLVEDLTDGVDALLVPPNDVPALVHAIARLLDDDGLRARLAHAARATFERRFSAAGFSRALREAYAAFGSHP